MRDLFNKNHGVVILKRKFSKLLLTCFFEFAHIFNLLNEYSHPK